MPGTSCHPAHGITSMAQPGTSLVTPSWHPVPSQISQPLPHAAHGPCLSVLMAPRFSPGTNFQATYKLHTHSQENQGCLYPVPSMSDRVHQLASWMLGLEQLTKSRLGRREHETAKE